MKTMSSAPITMTIVATVASPLNQPSRASARARHTVSAASTSAAPMPNAGPLTPAANPALSVHASANAAAAATPPSRPHHAKSGTATEAAISGHSDVAPENARTRAEAAPPAAHGAGASAASAKAATTMVARSRDDGAKPARASAVDTA